MDVSRQRTRLPAGAASTIAIADGAPNTAPVIPAAIAPVPHASESASEPAADSAGLQSHPQAESVLAEAALPVEEPITAGSAPAAPLRFSLDRPIELVTSPGESPADGPAVTATLEPAARENPLPAAVHPVTPRPPLDARRKSRMPFSEDWFAAHGRYIAVVFVIALIGTIYLARTNRRPATSASQPQAAAKSGDASAPAVDLPPLVAKSGPSAGNSPSNAPKLVDTASAAVETRTELHPPTTESAPPEAARPRDENLFVFPQAKKAEERVATRSDAPQALVNPNVTGQSPAAPSAAPPLTSSAAPALPSVAPPTISAMPQAPAPSLGPAYPTTSPSPTNYPTTSPPQYAYPTTTAPALTEAPAMPPRFAPGQPAPSPPVYPTTNAYQQPTSSPQLPQGGAWQPPGQQAPAQPPAGQGAWTPSSPGGWSPPVSSGGTPPQYQVPNNTASGFRNERTGSSLY
jgi:hypothetical protein